MNYSPPGSLSMGFSRQAYWSGLPFPSPGDLPDPGIEPLSPALKGGFLSLSHHTPHVPLVLKSIYGFLFLLGARQTFSNKPLPGSEHPLTPLSPSCLHRWFQWNLWGTWPCYLDLGSRLSHWQPSLDPYKLQLIRGACLFILGMNVLPKEPETPYMLSQANWFRCRDIFCVKNGLFSKCRFAWFPLMMRLGSRLFPGRITLEEPRLLLYRSLCFLIVAMGIKKSSLAGESSWPWTGLGTEDTAASRFLSPPGGKSRRELTPRLEVCRGGCALKTHCTPLLCSAPHSRGCLLIACVMMSFSLNSKLCESTTRALASSVLSGMSWVPNR